MQSSHYIAVETGLLNTVVVIVGCVFFRGKNLINFSPPTVCIMLVNVFLICTFVVRSTGVSFLSFTFTFKLINSSHNV